MLENKGEDMSSYNKVRVSTGRYDWLHPEDEQVCIWFTWREDAPENVQCKRNISVWGVGDGEEDFDCAIDAIQAIEEYMTKFSYNSAEDWVEVAAKYLWKMKDEDYRDSLVEEKFRLEKKLEQVSRDLERIS